jgi:GMP synthase (glutamine-hydrolysing)
MSEIVILVTGEPVEPVLATRGGFPAIIELAIGPIWRGGYRAVDARTDRLELDGAAAVVITGSSANVHHREPWMLRTEACLRDLVARDVPILGLCFGHQILAQALGGEVQPNPRGREMSTVTVERTGDDPIFEGIARRFAANACHVDTVARLPQGAHVLARSDLDPHQCLRFAPRCYGVQFHPEFDRAVMRGYVAARAEILATEGKDPAELGARASDTPESAKVLVNFLAHVAHAIP